MARERAELLGWEFESGHFDAKTQELMLWVACLAAHNAPGADLHKDHALRAGATDGELREAASFAMRAAAVRIRDMAAAILEGK
ncbi:MAG: carboxymuconolactone decarboxylase family protein [Nitrospinota bacterium]